MYSRKLRITISRVILQSICGCVCMWVTIITHMLNAIKIYKLILSEKNRRKKNRVLREEIYSKC
jgi:biopolymer transport protein ExbB/TolQ